MCSYITLVPQDDVFEQTYTPSGQALYLSFIGQWLLKSHRPTNPLAYTPLRNNIIKESFFNTIRLITKIIYRRAIGLSYPTSCQYCI